VPFALQQEAIRANGGRPLARSEVTAMQILAPALHVRMVASARGESRTGISRAARPAPAASPVPPLQASAPPVRPPAQVSAPVSAPAETPLLRGDRPPGAAGQSLPGDRGSANRVAPEAGLHGNAAG
jgi:hypothetical protein